MDEPTSVIQLEDLNFSYKKGEPILKNLNLNVTQGSIYGFLGANGAGKSTTIRALLGLMPIQSGKVRLLGKKLKKGDATTFKKIGTLIESPSLYEHLNAIDHLKIISKYHNISYHNIEPVLDRVGLLGAKRKTIKKYSMGMKQRLGLATAMMHNPDVLILDEPTNGLDPNGITEIRQLLLDLKKEGKTIMLSSHLLSEIEKMATHVGIIQNGSLVFEGEISALQALKSAQIIARINTSATAKAVKALTAYYVVSSTQEYLEVELKAREDLSTVIALLVSEGVALGEIQFQKNDLESLYMGLTN